MKLEHGFLRHAVLLSLVWIASACDNIDSTAPESNVPPVTTISGGPKPFDDNSYRVDLKWFGEDVDGSVDLFEYAWDDTSEWFETVLTGSTFVISADTCCIFDTLVSAETGTDSVVERFFQYHTFFIRSIDDGGLPDPTPAHVTFNSTTVAPASRITKGPPWDATSGRSVSIHWEGADPDHPDNAVAAYEYFHATKGQLTRDYAYDADAGFTNKVWNSLDWIRVGSDTTSVILRGLETGYGDASNSNKHFFFVRSIDIAGAVEQLPVPGENYTTWGATESPGGSILIRSNVMGVGGTGSNHVGQIFEGARIVFSWAANLGSYDGVVTGYSNAYDDRLWSAWDLEDDRYPRDGDFIPTRGRHSLFVRARDEAGEILEAEFPFEVYPGPDPDTTHVLVLSNFHIPGSRFYPSPETYERFWSDSILINFEHEFYDPHSEGDKDPPIRLLSRSTTVILPTDDWEGGAGNQPVLGEWHRNNANPLWSYVEAGGNLVLLGFYPAWNFLPDNNYIDTGFVPDPDPCFDWMTPKGCGSNLIWYQPLLADSFPHPLYEYCAVETTWLDETFDYMWGAKALLPILPDLHVISERSKNFDNHGLWNCERITFRGDRAPSVIPLYGFSRTVDPLTVDEPPNQEAVAIWVQASGRRGHVVYMGMPLYFFDPEETRDCIETILSAFLGEVMQE